MSEALMIHGPSRMAEAPGSRTQPSRGQREATDFEDREGHRAPFASVEELYPELNCRGTANNRRLRQQQVYET